MDGYQTSNPIKCRFCGFVWEPASLTPDTVLLTDGRVTKCCACPARTSPNGNASCQGCGCSVLTPFPNKPVFRCDSCIASGATRGRCCFPLHRGNRVVARSMVRQWIMLTPVKREERTVFACEQCAHRFNLAPWEEREAALFRETDRVPAPSERPQMNVTLTDNDPYRAVGGKANVWRPQRGLGGVGAYLLFQYERDQRVFLDGRQYRLRVGRCEGSTVACFAVLNGVSVGEWVFLAVVGVEPNSYKHRYIIHHGDRDAVMEAALSVTTEQGALVVDSNNERKV